MQFSRGYASPPQSYREERNLKKKPRNLTNNAGCFDCQKRCNHNGMFQADWDRELDKPGVGVVGVKDSIKYGCNTSKGGERYA